MRFEFERWRWNAITIGGVIVMFLFSYFLIPDPVLRFGSYLVLFTLWMIWFVITSVQYLRYIRKRDADETGTDL